MSSGNNTKQDHLMSKLGGKQPSLSAPGTEAFDKELCDGIPCVVQINNDAIIKSDDQQRIRIGLANPLEETGPSTFSLLITHENYGVVIASLDVLGFHVRHLILSWDVRSLAAAFVGDRIPDLSKASVHLRELFAQEPNWAKRGLCLTFTISNATAVRIWKTPSPEAGEIQDHTTPSIDPQFQEVVENVEDPNAGYKLRVWFLLPEEKVDEYNGEWITRINQWMTKRTPAQSIDRQNARAKAKLLSPT